jgi:uncharacterized damage-inducible protein DinB
MDYPMGLRKPSAEEYPSAYAPYVAAAEDGDGVALLRAQLKEVTELFGGLTESQSTFRYAPGKWSLKDLLLHLSDAERIFAYRCLRFGRGDGTPLAGFDEDAYAAAADAEHQALTDLLTDWQATRAALISLCQGLPDAAWNHRGVSNGKELTARCLPYICLGHTAHHLAVIRERYLPALK